MSVAVLRASDAFTPRQLATIKRTIAADTNAEEFDLFIEYARVKGLDPFSRQVIPIVFSKNDATKRRMSIVTTQDGQRVLAARCRDYRPAETEPEFEIIPELKSDANPIGIVKCTTTLWKQDGRSGEWHPVKGWAYWNEYAPLREVADEYEFVDTGEVWPDTGKPKKRKQKKQGAAVRTVLDPTGNWPRMPRVMIAKCATMQALRAGWPDTFGGVVAEEEMDRAKALDLTATEIVEREFEERRMHAIAASSDEYPWVGNDGNLVFVSAGQFGSHVLNIAHGCKTKQDLDTIKVRNREGLKRYWAKHKDDALQINKELEAIAAKLPEAPQVSA